MRPPRAAGLDVGSNSFLLLVLQRGDDGREQVVLDRADIVRLGQGVSATGQLDPEIMRRALDLLADYTQRCADLSVQQIRAVGTAALRSASNSAEFRRLARAETGVEIEVVSGQREAELTFAAVSAERPLAGKLLNIDIGGGSTELSLGRAGLLSKRISYDLGANNLTEQTGPHADPPSDEQIVAMRAMAQAMAREAAAEFDSRGVEAVGVGGTITTMAAITLALGSYDAQAVARHLLTLEQIDALVDRLAALPLAEREQVVGLSPKRAPVIVAGAILCAELVRELGLGSLGVSAGGLRYTLAREALAAVVSGAGPAGDGAPAAR